MDTTQPGLLLRVRDAANAEPWWDFDLSPNRLYKIKWRLTRKLREKMKELLTGAE